MSWKRETGAIAMRSMGALLYIALLLWPSNADAHAHLDYAIPAAGSTVATPPNQITLHFSEKLEPKFSKAEVFSASGARVDTGSSVSGSVVTVTVGTLTPGTYRIKWRVLSVDTHSTQGSFNFRVGK